jgi:hypothetical protein
MKKKLALALVASLALTTGSAFAAEVSSPDGFQLDGSLNLQYRNDTKMAGTSSKNVHDGFKETLTLNMSQKITDNVDFYTRFTYQNVGAGLQNDAEDYRGKIGGNSAAFDAFGLKVATGTWNWKIGSQPLTVGAQGLVYDNGFIGRNALPYAISGAGKIGAIDTVVYDAKTNYQVPVGNQDKFYGTNLSYSIDDNNKIGAFYAHWTPSSDTANWGTNLNQMAIASFGSLNAYGFDYSHQFEGKLSFASEYAKTNAKVDNKAYIAGFGYAVDADNKVAAKYYRSEGYSQIWDKNFGGMGTTPNPDTKGFILSLNHAISKTTSASLSYDSEKTIKGTYGIGSRNRTVAAYNVTF